jgi:hypothetical protein
VRLKEAGEAGLCDLCGEVPCLLLWRAAVDVMRTERALDR